MIIDVLCRGPTQAGNLIVNRYVATTASGYGQGPEGSSVRIIEEDKIYFNTREED